LADRRAGSGGCSVNRIGIRHEDKSRWEARVPIVPADMKRLIDEKGLAFSVEASPTRAFSAEDYRSAGADVTDDLSGCPIIMGVKEIPVAKIRPNKTYVYFSHTIKGQSGNMPALRKLIETDCQLIDYEKIVDDKGRRLVFFGNYAGLAGMIDTLWALGERLRVEGVGSPFERVRPAHAYHDLEHVREAFRAVGEEIRRGGLPALLQPFVCGFAGYGQVSKGAQEIFDLLPVEEVRPEDLSRLDARPNVCRKVVFREEHMIVRLDATQPFNLQEYYDHPLRYRSRFADYLPYLTLLVNCIYWESRYPRLVTVEQLRTLYGGSAVPRLRVIGDISCDLNGSIECTVKTTTPDAPVFVYEAASGRTRDGVEGRGPVVLAVDFLPCELPVDASRFFSRSLFPFIEPLAKADFVVGLAESGLPVELQKATIVYHGDLTPPYRYLEKFLR